MWERGFGGEREMSYEESLVMAQETEEYMASGGGL